jgi:hypothetical protein
MSKSQSVAYGRLLAQVLEEYAFVKLCILEGMGVKVFSCDICGAYPRYVHGDAVHKAWGLAPRNCGGTAVKKVW